MADEIKNLEMRITGDAGSAEAALQKLTTIMGQFNASVARQNASLAALNAQSRQQTDALKVLSVAATKAAAEEKKFDDTSKALATDLRAATAAMQQAAKATNDLAAAHREAARAAKEQASQETATAAAAASSSRAMIAGAAAVAVAIGGVALAAAATKATISEAFDQLDRGIKVDNITRAFESLQADAGLFPVDQIQKLRESTRGLISDFELMEKSNLWQTLRLAPDQFDELSGAAIKLGASVGREAGQAINDLTVGLGRMSPRILDNIGIIVKAEEAQELYAASIGKTVDKLTDEERRTAFLTLAIERIQEAAAKLPEPAENAGRAYERLKANVANAADAFAVAVANSEPLKDAIQNLDTLLKETDWARWGDLFAGAASKAVGALNALLSLIPDANNKFVQLGDRFFGVSDEGKLAALYDERERLAPRTGLFGGADRYEHLRAPLRDKNQAAINALEAQIKAPRLESENKSILGVFNSTFDNLKNGLLGDFDFEEIAQRQGEAARKAAEKAAKEQTRAAEQAAKEVIRINEKLAQDLAKIQAGAQKEALEQQFKGAAASGDTGAMASLREAYRKSVADGIRAGYSDEIAKGGAEAAAKVDQIVATKLSQEFVKAENAALKSLEKIEREAAGKRLSEQIETAYKEGNLAAIPELQQRQRDAIYRATYEGIGGGTVAATPLIEEAAKRAAEIQAQEYERTTAKRIREANEEAFRNSVDFFADLLTPMFEGESQNFEELFKGAAKRVAIGFASQMAASFATSLGVGGLGDLTNAQGLGQSIAASLGFEGGGVKGIGDLFGEAPLVASATALDFAAANLTAAAGALAGAAGTGGILSGTGDLLSTSIGGLGLFGGAGAGAAGATAGTGAFDVLAAGGGGAAAGGGGFLAGLGPYGLAAGAALAIGGGLIASGVFDGKNPDRERRMDLRGQLQQTGLGENLVFGGVNGPISLFDQGYNLDTSNPLSGQAAGLVNPLGFLQAGGSDTGGQQLAAIFANAVSDAKNFNEVLVNTQSLMDKIGIDATEAKTDLASLFLDGRVKLDEFGAGLQSLNTLAQDNLVGTGSVKDAVEILANAIDSDPRVALKALEFAFKEMAELGITSTEQIRTYVAENFGPDVQDVFDELAAAGIASWEDIQGASADTLFAIFSTLDRFKTELVNTFGDAAREANNAFDLSGSRDEIQKTITKSKELRSEYDRLPG